MGKINEIGYYDVASNSGSWLNIPIYGPWESQTWSGKLGRWLFREMFPLRASEMELLRAKAYSLDSRLSGALKDHLAVVQELNALKDQMAAKTLELESLKNKIVERAQVQPIIRAKSAAEIRRMVEAQNEREFEESANGI